MIERRPHAELGHARHGWLNARHHFSFAEYHDAQRMRWGRLRVWNDDSIAPHSGFEPHGHRDMEIITYVRQGAITHEDSLGNRGRTVAGDVQVMSAGSGVSHSEFNHSTTDPVHFLQIWVFPDSENIEPSYRETHFAPETKRGQLRLIASPDGADGSLRIQQDARIYATILDGSQKLHHALGNGRGAYVQVARGQLQVNGITLDAGDALQVSDEAQLTLENGNDAEVLVFDLPL